MAKKIVILDDSKTIHGSLELALSELIKSNQLFVTKYTDPIDFLADIENESINFDLMFSDINMPQMSGLEVVKRLKSNDKYRNKKILMLTTDSSDEAKQIGKDIGVTGWIVKPFNSTKILKAVKQLLGV